jgi:hypothetical protein
MDVSNPYAPPQAPIQDSGVSTGGGGAWRLRDDILIVQKGGVLPDVCVFAGEATRAPAQRVRRKLRWSPPVAFVMLVVFPLLGFILVMALRKTGWIDYALGEEGRRRRRIGTWLVAGSLAGLVAFVALVAGAELGRSLLPFVIIGFLITFVVGLTRQQPFRVVKIDRWNVHLKLRREAKIAFARIAQG